MDTKFDPSECKRLFGIEYTDLLKLRKHNQEMLKDHSIENEVYIKIVTLDAGLEGIFKLFK